MPKLIIRLGIELSKPHGIHMRYNKGLHIGLTHKTILQVTFLDIRPRCSDHRARAAKPVEVTIMKLLAIHCDPGAH